jgi:hypothetical protein
MGGEYRIRAQWRDGRDGGGDITSAMKYETNLVTKKKESKWG